MDGTASAEFFAAPAAADAPRAAEIALGLVTSGDPADPPADGLAHVVDVLAAAVYIGEADLFAEGMRWLDALLTGRTGSCAGAHAVLDAGLRDLPTARDVPAAGRDQLTPL
ncbi:hypothetical protein [Pseudonocardia humida]|uniref:Uncharacterized protein n=1 Tax=Pseudonocardia humida TaxID=2800819 RepID=A0ABT1A1W1_9PSEU|nr:hypothetical protein [Pseudonocardia humida]MCO1656996.1 hypothetical protein [Pseudonocardia humida]